MTKSTPPVTVFALHGFTGAGDDFLSLQKNCPASWRWHHPDLPGHGENPMPPVDDAFSLSAHLNFLENERAKITAAPCVLLGYSMGGRIALHWALQKPSAFSALILIGASPGIEDQNERLARQKTDTALAEKIITDGVVDFQKYWWSQPLFSGLKNLPPEEIASLETRRHRNCARHLAASLRGVGTGALPALWRHLPSLKIPVLCVAGASDEKFVRIAKEMNSRLTEGAVSVIPEAGHMAHVEASDAVAEVVQAFVKKQLRLDT